jgi:hypothetical protein
MRVDQNNYNPEFWLGFNWIGFGFLNAQPISKEQIE